MRIWEAQKHTDPDPQHCNKYYIHLFYFYLLTSLLGRVWTLATEQPTFFRAAPILFPPKIVSMMRLTSDGGQIDRKKQKLLHAMEVRLLCRPKSGHVKIFLANH
jgi:hypothetical protein